MSSSATIHRAHAFKARVAPWAFHSDRARISATKAWHPWMVGASIDSIEQAMFQARHLRIHITYWSPVL